MFWLNWSSLNPRSSNSAFLEKGNGIYGVTDTLLDYFRSYCIYLEMLWCCAILQTDTSLDLSKWRRCHLIIFYWASIMCRVLNKVGPIISWAIGLGLLNLILLPKWLLSVLWLLYWVSGDIAKCFPSDTLS